MTREIQFDNAKPFTPDWDVIAGANQSLREHMAIAKSEQIGILQDWIDGEISEGQAMAALGVPRVYARRMKFDAINDGLIVELEDDHGHVCPGCGQTFTCYQDCPEEMPEKRCNECK